MAAVASCFDTGSQGLSAGGCGLTDSTSLPQEWMSQSSPTTGDLVCWMKKHRAGGEGRAVILGYIMTPTRTIWPGGCGGHHKPVGLRIKSQVCGSPASPEP